MISPYCYSMTWNSISEATNECIEGTYIAMSVPFQTRRWLQRIHLSASESPSIFTSPLLSIQPSRADSPQCMSRFRCRSKERLFLIVSLLPTALTMWLVYGCRHHIELTIHSII